MGKEIKGLGELIPKNETPTAPDCSVRITSGPTTLPAGASGTFVAAGDPAPGTYIWGVSPAGSADLSPSGASAAVTAKSGPFQVTVQYVAGDVNCVTLTTVLVPSAPPGQPSTPTTAETPPPTPTEPTPPTATEEKPPVTAGEPPPHGPGEHPTTYSPPEEPPPLHGPEYPPPPHRPEYPPPHTYASSPCCGKNGDVITFPRITDPMEIPKDPEAPRDPAVGAYQVFLHNGAFFTNDVDLSLPAPALPIIWARHWRGKVDFNEGGLIGYGWDFSFNKRIVPIGKKQLPNGLMVEQAGVDRPSLVFYDGLGHAEGHHGVHSEERHVRNFDRDFDAYVTTYIGPRGFFHEIERYIVIGPPETHPFRGHPNIEPTETIFYVLREKNGTRFVFNCRGQLIYVLSRHDNNESGYGQGRVRIELQYLGKLNPLTQNPMLSLIRDPVGRTYSVDTVDIHSGEVLTNINCELVSGVFAIPHIKRMSGSGLTVEYSYRAGDTEPVLDATDIKSPDITQRTEYTYDDSHRITSIKDPNETAKGQSGKAYVNNQYDGEGRVDSQQLGDIPFSIAYENAQATVTDANGTDRIYGLDQTGGYPVIGSSTVKAEDGREWETVFNHNGDTQVTKVTYPRGNGYSYEYDPANRTVKEGPIRDWKDRDYTYENNLARGNLKMITRFGLEDGESWVSHQAYEPLYNQASETIERGGLKSKATYRYEAYGERGEPITVTGPPLMRPDDKLLIPPPTVHTYNFRGQPTRIDLGDGHVTSYTYNLQTGFLDRVDRADGSYSAFQYDERGNITDETGTRGHVHMSYDGRGLLTERVVDPDKAKITTRYEYNPDGHPTRTKITVSDLFSLDGQTSTTSQKAPAPRPNYDRVVETEYDVLNRPVLEAVSGGREKTSRRYEYYPDGTTRRVRSSALNGSDEYVVQYEYDPRGLAKTITSAAGTPVEKSKTIEYDDNGNQAEITEAEGAPTVHVEYDGLDQLKLQKTTPGSTQHFEYDPRGNLKHVSVEGPTGPDEDTATLYSADLRYDAYGNLVQKAIDTLDEGSEVTEWYYDTHLRLESTKAPNGGITRFEYDLGDRVKVATDPIGNSVETNYDKAGHPSRVVRHVKEWRYVPGSNNFQNRTVTYESRADYDRLGRISASYGSDGKVRERYLYDSEGNTRVIISTSQGQIENVYDGLGRLQAVRRPDGFELTSYTAGGLVLEHEYGTHHVRNEYDAAGRLTREVDVNTNLASTFQYDPQGRPLKTVDRNGTELSFGYDKNGLRHTVAITPSAMVMQYKDQEEKYDIPAYFGPTAETYDMDGLGRVVDAFTDQDVKVAMAYDGLSRITLETQILDGNSQTLARKFAPDLTWSETTYPEIAGGVVVRRNLDLLGRVNEVAVDGKTIAKYVYGAPERLAARVTGNGWLTRYDYDNRERPVGLGLAHQISGSNYTPLWSQGMAYSDAGSLQFTTETYMPLGEQAGRTLQTVYAYDDQNRVTRTQTHQTTLQAGAGSMNRPDTSKSELTESGMLWGYDGGGNLATVGEWAGGGAETSVAAVRSDSYSYDGQGRITGVTTKGRQDMVGKSIPTKQEADFTAFLADLSGTTTGTQEFKYDNQGNLIFDGRFFYSYDYRGRLTRVVDSWSPFRYSESIRFHYDPLGRRVASLPMRDRVPGALMAQGPVWNRSSQRYLYDGAATIADVWTGPGSEPPFDKPPPKSEPRLLGRYFTGAQPGELLRMDRRAEEQPGEDLRVLYVHQDMQGGVRFVSDLYAMLPFAIVSASPAPGQAPPGGPPEDQRLVAGTNVRVPYVSGRTRIDGFAGTLYREDMAESPVDYRSAWWYRRYVEHDALRNDRIAQQNSLQMEVGAYIAMMAAPAFAEGAGSLAMSLYENGFIAGALQNAVIAGTSSVGYSAIAAIRTGTSYSLSEATDDFASSAGMALLSSGIGAGIGSLGLGKVGTFLATTAVNNWAIPSSQLMLHGMDPGDAITSDAMSRALYTAADVGIGIGARYARAALSRASAKLSRVTASNPSGGGRPVQAAQASPHEIYVDAGRESDAARHNPGALVKAKSEHLKAADAGILSAMEKDGRPAQVIARLIRDGDFNIVYYRGHRGNEGKWLGYHDPMEPGTIYVNLDTLRKDPGGNVISINRYQAAAVAVHEGAHALGGTEVVAFAAEADFMASTVQRRRATSDEITQWFGSSGGKQLMYFYNTARRLGDFMLLRNYIMSQYNYTYRDMMKGAGEHQAITEVAGFNNFLGFSDPMLDVYEKAARNARSVPSTYVPRP